MRLLLLVFSALAYGCGSITSLVGPCRALQIDEVGEKLVAICWSDEPSILEMVNRSDFLGPAAPGALELFEQFAGDRDQLQPRGATEPRNLSGFVYRMSYPQIVQGRSQYNLEVTLPEPLPTASLVGPAKDVVDFVKAKHPDAGVVSLELMPQSNGALGGVILHFDKWSLQRLTLERSRSKS